MNIEQLPNLPLRFFPISPVTIPKRLWVANLFNYFMIRLSKTIYFSCRPKLTETGSSSFHCRWERMNIQLDMSHSLNVSNWLTENKSRVTVIRIIQNVIQRQNIERKEKRNSYILLSMISRLISPKRSRNSWYIFQVV